jgi:hypothetical protein
MHAIMPTTADPSSQKTLLRMTIQKIITVIPNAFVRNLLLVAHHRRQKTAFIFTAKNAKPLPGISSRGAVILRVTSCL